MTLPEQFLREQLNEVRECLEDHDRGEISDDQCLYELTRLASEQPTSRRELLTRRDADQRPCRWCGRYANHPVHLRESVTSQETAHYFAPRES